MYHIYLENNVINMESRIVRDKKAKIITDFCANIKQLVYVANNLIPNNPNLMVLQQGTRFVANNLGPDLIEIIGPEVYVYRNDIVANNFNFINNIDFNQKINEQKDSFSDETNSRLDEYRKLIPMVLSCYNTCNSSEQQNIHKLITNLLLGYAQYVTHEKKYGTT